VFEVDELLFLNMAIRKAVEFDIVAKNVADFIEGPKSKKN
jgi:hypothetical protein